MRILVSGDWHIDGSKIGKLNVDTDLDLRTEDFLKAIDKMIDYAIETKVDLFIMNGDLFKGRTSTHHIETLIAERFQKLAKNTKLIINLGNHDYTPKQLTYGIHTYSILERLDLKDVLINLELNHLTFNDCEIVLYPYYDLKRCPEFKSNEDLLDNLHQKIKSFNFSKSKKLFIGHGTPSGTILNEDFYFDLDIIDEPILPKEWFEDFDIALFSHIHREHWIGDKIFHIGSPERVDFSEASDDKGFVVYDTTSCKLEWHSLSPRPMKDIKLDLLSLEEWDDPTDLIISAIEEVDNLSDTMIKIQVECTEAILARIDQLRLRHILQKSFFYKPIKYEVPKIQKSKMKEVNEQLNPEQVLEKVLFAREDLSEMDKKLIYTKAKMIMAMGD